MFCQITTYTKDGLNKISLTGCDARIFCLGVRIVKRRTVPQVAVFICLFICLWQVAFAISFSTSLNSFHGSRLQFQLDHVICYLHIICELMFLSDVMESYLFKNLRNSLNRWFLQF